MPTSERLAIRRTGFDPALDPRTRNVTITIELVAPDLAQLWLDNYNNGNRNMSRNAIKRYVRDMIDSNWIFGGSSVMFDVNGRLINSQHTLTSIVESGISQPLMILRGLDPKLRAVLDAPVLRNAAHALGFSGVEKNAVLNAAITRLLANYELGTIKYSGWDYSGSKSMTNSEVVDTFVANPDIESAASWTAGRRHHFKGGMLTPGQLGLIRLLSQRVDELASDEFFNSIIERRTDGINDPRNAFMNKLSTLSDVKDRTVGTRLFVFSRSWNAWRRGEILSARALSHQTRKTDDDGNKVIAYQRIPSLI